MCPRENNLNIMSFILHCISIINIYVFLLISINSVTHTMLLENYVGKITKKNV